jgi:hypothetical protein
MLDFLGDMYGRLLRRTAGSGELGPGERPG